MKTTMLEEAIGWYGAVAIVGAYALTSFGVVSPQTALYQALNATGALGIVYISFKKEAYQPGALNVIWAVIAIVALIRLFIS